MQGRFERRIVRNSSTETLGTLVGNTVTNRAVRVLGKDETTRWMEFGDLSGEPREVEEPKYCGKCSWNPGNPGSLSKFTRCVVGYCGFQQSFLDKKAVRGPPMLFTGHKGQRHRMFTRTEPT